MTLILKKITYIFLFTLLLTNSIFSQDKPQAVIIFDASGSMWGQIDGVNKITIAKDALNSVVKEWSPDVELGLTAYGHRKKGDCNDIETLVPVGAVDKDKIISIVKKIQPKGKTPIARSLQKVAEELKFTEEKATIILISDGKESCDANPCDVAKELEKKGIDFVTHVIGFNVDKKTDKELECIADATGGEYFSAKNATALNEAMKTIVKKVEKVQPKPTPKPTPKKLKNNLEVTASEKEGSKWVDAACRVYKMVDGKLDNSDYWNVNPQKKRAGTRDFPIGKYQLNCSYNQFNTETPFELKSGEVTKLHIIMGQTGTVEITASEKEGSKWVDAACRVYKMVDGKLDNSDYWNVNPQKKRAGTRDFPIGKYQLNCSYNQFNTETPFELKSGEVTKLHIVFEQFVIQPKCTDMNSKVNYEIYATSGRMVEERKQVCSKPLQLSLNKGDYRVEAKIGNATKEEKFSIGGNSKTLTIDLSNLNHEEEIKADSETQSTSTSTLEPTSTPIKKVEQKVEKEQKSSVAKIEDNPLEAIGALLGAVNGTVKESKPLQAMKASTEIAIPYMEKTKECYSDANTLDEAKLCDNIANEGVKEAHKVMKKVSGISIKMPKEIAQKEWNEEIKKEKVAQEISDLAEAKLNLVCIDKGASMKKLQACVLAKGELDNSPTELDQLGNFFNMLGGMK